MIYHDISVYVSTSSIDMIYNHMTQTYDIF